MDKTQNLLAGMEEEPHWGENFSIPEAPVYKPGEVPSLTTETPAHAGVFNSVFGRLLENTHAVATDSDTRLNALQNEVETLRDSVLNNMINNVFVVNFDSLESVNISRGIYDPTRRKIYV